MKRIVVILILFFICSNCEAFIRERQLDPNHLLGEFNIEVEKNDQLIVFKVNWSKYTEHANNTQAFLQISNDTDTLVLNEVATNLYYRTQYIFSVNVNLLNNSKFSIIKVHKEHPDADVYWFNLKKMYDGLKAIEEKNQ